MVGARRQVFASGATDLLFVRAPEQRPILLSVPPLSTSLSSLNFDPPSLFESSARRLRAIVSFQSRHRVGWDKTCGCNEKMLI